jgi:hypothetical protein
MRSSIGTAGISLFIALQFLLSSASRADASRGDTASTAPPPAAAETPADTAEAVGRFVPVIVSTVTSTDADVSLGNRMDLTTNAGRGWTFTNTITIDRRSYRQRALQELSESFMNTAAKGHPGLYMLDLNIGEKYRKSKSLGLGRFGQDIIFDNEEAGVKLVLTKPILKSAASRLTLAGSARKGTNDFKFDRALLGSAGGALNYAFGELLSVRGGGWISGRRETSDIGKARFGPLRSDADTLNAGLSYGTGEKKTLKVAYSVYNGVERRVMPPLGNTYEVLNDPTKAKQEETRNRLEALDLSSFLQPFSFLLLDFKFSHEIVDAKYKVDTRLSNNSESNYLDAAASYQYASEGSVKFTVSTRDDVSDYGPVSLSSYREREHIVGVGLSQTIGEPISVSASGSGALKQRFYLKQDQNPRDADYLYYRGDLGFRATTKNKKVSTDVKMTVDRYETINIDNTLSRDNRVDYKYQVGPTITVNPAAWVSISQDYILKIEYTDFVFTEDKNYLNRTTSLNTRANFKVFSALKLGFMHGFFMRDTGSYLMRGAGRRYSPTNDTRDNTLGLDFRYAVGAGFEMMIESDFSIQRNQVFGSKEGRKIVASTSTVESGSMRTGFTRSKEFGGVGDIELNISYVRYYGPYITPENREYVEANSTITLKF